jgi:hypothetical protein
MASQSHDPAGAVQARNLSRPHPHRRSALSLLLPLPIVVAVTLILFIAIELAPDCGSPGASCHLLWEIVLIFLALLASLISGIMALIGILFAFTRWWSPRDPVILGVVGLCLMLLISLILFLFSAR